MAAPQPMVRPDFYGVRKQNQGEISVFLPRASEEYGPISHYYVIVIPNSNSSAVRYPDQYNTEDLVAYSKSKLFFSNIFCKHFCQEYRVIGLKFMYFRLTLLSIFKEKVK